MRIKNNEGIVIFANDDDYTSDTIESAVSEGVSLARADLRGACLYRVNLHGANFEGANLEGADLGQTDLSEANLKFANLQGANFDGADLRTADLRGADLKDSNITQEQLDSAFNDNDPPCQNIDCLCKTPVKTGGLIKEPAEPSVGELKPETDRQKYIRLGNQHLDLVLKQVETENKLKILQKEQSDLATKVNEVRNDMLAVLQDLQK